MNSIVLIINEKHGFLFLKNKISHPEEVSKVNKCVTIILFAGNFKKNAVHRDALDRKIEKERFYEPHFL